MLISLHPRRKQYGNYRINYYSSSSSNGQRMKQICFSLRMWEHPQNKKGAVSDTVQRGLIAIISEVVLGMLMARMSMTMRAELVRIQNQDAPGDMDLCKG